MQNRSLFVLMLLALLVGCTRPEPTGPPAADSKAHGQRLVAELDLDAAQLAKFAQHLPSERAPHDSPLEAMLAAETEGWRGEPVLAEAGRNPYTLVVTIAGTAAADGDAMGMWMAGWQDDEGISKLFPLSGVGKLRAVAGERFIAVAAATPVRLTEGKQYSPELELRDLGGVSVQSLRLQVWSGVPDASPLEHVFAWRLLWVGVVGFFMWWLFFGRS